MEFAPYDPVVTKEESRELWNVKFFDRDGRPRNVACVNEEEAHKMSKLVRTAGDLVLNPFQIMQLEMATGKKEYAALGHVDKSLFVALVNFECETQFHPEEAQHTYVRPRDASAKPGPHLSFEHCESSDARAFAATIIVPAR